MESIGGLGANVAGKILAEAGVLQAGLNATNFASYGSEKKGSPVKSFVRFSDGDREIRDATPVIKPHVLAVFHEALLRSGDGVLQGVDRQSVVIVNTRRSPEELARILEVDAGVVGAVPALDIAVQEKSRVNMAMLGAVVKACPFLAPEDVEEVLKTTLGVRYPHLLEANLRAFRRGYEECRWLDRRPAPDRLAGAEGSDNRAPSRANGQAADAPVHVVPPPLLGYLTAPIGGTILAPGSTATKDLSASRQGFLPQFLREKCTDCAKCEWVCPDFCFVWQETTDKKGRPTMQLVGIDYQYCKGCLKCVEICPVEALVPLAEADGWSEQHRVPQPWAQPVEPPKEWPTGVIPAARDTSREATTAVPGRVG